MLKLKIKQAADILSDMDIDLWMIICRESETMTDPSLELMVGEHVSGSGAFMISKTSQTTALLWVHDAANIERLGVYDKVETYAFNFGNSLKRIIEEYNPRKIALNYSLSSFTADGITYGMYLKLLEFLKDTPYADRIISAEEILFKLRARKIKPEIESLQKAAILAETCWHDLLREIQPGMTEIEISDRLRTIISNKGSINSFTSIVNAGAKTSPGHGLPTDAVLERGDLLHIDFGVKIDGYCSDIQRLAYFKKNGESSAPEELVNAFNKVKEIIDVTSKLYKPGALGIDIDNTARKILTDAGYPEYQHSLGHQIGKSVHDGGAKIGPKYEESDTTPLIPLELNNTFTVELGIAVPGIGYVGLEEDLVVTENGGKILCPRQTDLVVV